MNNQVSLNPEAALVVKRYDQVDPELAKKYERDMRNFIAHMSVDADVAGAFRQHLLQLWKPQEMQSKDNSRSD